MSVNVSGLSSLLHYYLQAVVKKNQENVRQRSQSTPRLESKTSRIERVVRTASNLSRIPKQISTVPQARYADLNQTFPTYKQTC
jgi:hypothetical protein